MRLLSGQDGENCFFRRKPLIAEAIAQEAPHIICFQEVLPHVALWIKETFPDYMLLGCGRDQELSSGALYDIWNTHLDHISSNARLLGIRQLLEQMADSRKRKAGFGSFRQILAGDLNALADSEEITYLREHSNLKDVTCTLGGSFHDFGKLAFPEKIDYVFSEETDGISDVKLWTKQQDHIYLSDHFPISVTFC